MRTKFCKQFMLSNSLLYSIIAGMLVNTSNACVAYLFTIREMNWMWDLSKILFWYVSGSTICRGGHFWISIWSGSRITSGIQCKGIVVFWFQINFFEDFYLIGWLVNLDVDEQKNQMSLIMISTIYFRLTNLCNLWRCSNLVVRP